MADQFFTNTQDLMSWIQHNPSGDYAANALVQAISATSKDSLMVQNDEKSIKDMCRRIYNGKEDTSTQEDAKVLYTQILAKYKLTNIIKEAGMNKITTEAQSTSRQRNEWTRGERNKWNRVVDGFNEGTPWRVDRNKMFNFTHYYTDAISFSEDPSQVYSGEALWRMYVMDKFTREHQDKNGKWVGGYINDRFYVFPDAGTPSNPDVPRDGGNQMGLAAGERTRKSKPENWSVERRMEEARGSKIEDLEVSASTFQKTIKTASSTSSLPQEIETDRVFSIFRDVLGMREDNIPYEKRLELISDHYNTKITHVAQIEKEVDKIIKKHNGIGYSFQKKANLQTAKLTSPVQVQFQSGTFNLPAGTSYVDKGNSKVQIVDVIPEFKALMNQEGVVNPKALANSNPEIQEIDQNDADDIGLNEDIQQPSQSSQLSQQPEQTKQPEQNGQSGQLNINGPQQNTKL